MAAYETSRPVAPSVFGGLARRVFAALAAWNDARITRRALEKLSDRELDDIGLCRGDIDDIAARAGA